MPYDVADDPYLDKETGILRNLLGIKTKYELAGAEARLTAVEITALMTEGIPPYNEFTKNLFLDVHKQIFKDIYNWAGKIRTVELSKDGTSFARVEHIDASLEGIFRNIEQDEFLVDLDFASFVDKIAHYYGELIVLHPFRDGNGRVIRTFLAMLANSTGWHIAWDEMNPPDNVNASIAAYNGDEVPMRILLENIITPVDVFWGRDPYEFI